MHRNIKGKELQIIGNREGGGGPLAGLVEHKPPFAIAFAWLKLLDSFLLCIILNTFSMVKNFP